MEGEGGRKGRGGKEERGREGINLLRGLLKTLKKKKMSHRQLGPLHGSSSPQLNSFSKVALI